MLPIFPQTPGPERTEPTIPAPSYANLWLYGIAGALSGAAVCGAGSSLHLAIERLMWLPFAEGIRFDRMEGEMLLGSIAAGGIIFGPLFGVVLWIISFLWQASKHPLRCGSLCASLCGTVCLVCFAWKFDINSANGEAFIVLGIIMVGGAFYGFATTWLVRIAQGIIARYRA
jgi:hypothetical protein